MEKIRRLIWDDYALIDFLNSLKWISKESVHDAERVEKVILEKLELIRRHPERYPPDRFKKDNLGNYRAIEIYNYRISYKYEKEEIQILRFRHVKQEPFVY